MQKKTSYSSRLSMRPQGCCRPNTTMTGSHSNYIYGLSFGYVKTRRLPIVVNVTVAVWLLLLGKLETLGSSFRHETRIFCEAAAVLYYYN